MAINLKAIIKCIVWWC